MKRPLASKITETMATWKFIFIFLVLCILEIWFNHTSFVSDNVKFDPNTIILNLFLSLIAAVQGSIIMIDQRRADAKRDTLMKSIERLEKRILKDIEKGK